MRRPWGFPPLDQIHGAATATFEFSYCSFWSHTYYYTGVQKTRCLWFCGTQYEAVG